MQISKSRFPQDLSALFIAVKETAVSAAKYLADLIRTFSQAIYSSIENMVGRLKPSRVTVLKPPQFIVVNKTPQPQTTTATKTRIASEVPPQKQNPQPLTTGQDKTQATVDIPPRKEDAQPKATAVEVEKKGQFPTFNDVSEKLYQMADEKTPDLEASVWKMINLARGIINAPIENKEDLYQQLLDPFHTSVTELDHSKEEK